MCAKKCATRAKHAEEMLYACWACASKNAYTCWACANKMPTYAEHTVKSQKFSNFLKQNKKYPKSKELKKSFRKLANEKMREKTWKSWQIRNNFEFLFTVPKSPSHGDFMVKRSWESIRLKISRLGIFKDYWKQLLKKCQKGIGFTSFFQKQYWYQTV